MSEDKQPVTDAVRDAYAQKKSVNWAMDIWGADPEKPHLNRKVVEVVGSVLLGHSFRTVSGDGRGQPCDPADAASALRLVADALSRDPAHRALEIAATEISDATGMSPRDEAARLLEQAENAAAGPEELVLTDDKAFDDMLERMRKRCIHGR